MARCILAVSLQHYCQAIKDEYFECMQLLVICVRHV